MKNSQIQYGVSFDGFYGFPIFEEVSSTIIVCTCPGYHVGAITRIKRRRKPLKQTAVCDTILSSKTNKEKNDGNNN